MTAMPGHTVLRHRTGVLPRHRCEEQISVSRNQWMDICHALLPSYHRHILWILGGGSSPKNNDRTFMKHAFQISCFESTISRFQSDNISKPCKWNKSTVIWLIGWFHEEVCVIHLVLICFDCRWHCGVCSVTEYETDINKQKLCV